MQNIATAPMRQQILPQQRSIQPSHPIFSSSSALSQPVALYPIKEQFRENATSRETTTLPPSTAVLKNKSLGDTVVVSDINN